ncbi:uncharacterized protein LOC130735224 [Lotus japonicus]|uniref:uncharacterized protein LOC130735224 n=1 Tax=Lotus japonicus TaxID=34305 RepID=UPI002583FBA9|nr:uncharacterized protein LOC130735224 [Lotus japonicus]
MPIKEQKPKKESKSNQMGDALAAWTEASKVRAVINFARAEKLMAKNVENTPDYSMAKCMTVLGEIEDISDDLFAKAIENFEKLVWRETFLTMPSDRRKGWLVKL